MNDDENDIENIDNDDEVLYVANSIRTPLVQHAK
jgi:hypothetical protein